MYPLIADWSPCLQYVKISNLLKRFLRVILLYFEISVPKSNFPQVSRTICVPSHYSDDMGGHSSARGSRHSPDRSHSHMMACAVVGRHGIHRKVVFQSKWYYLLGLNLPQLLQLLSRLQESLDWKPRHLEHHQVQVQPKREIPPTPR